VWDPVGGIGKKKTAYLPIVKVLKRKTTLEKVLRGGSPNSSTKKSEKKRKKSIV